MQSFYSTLNIFCFRGKFGVVSKCVDKRTNVEYAAKFIKCRPSERKNVINEIDIMNTLNHKRLINMVGAFEFSRQIVLVLELVTGGELFEKLTEEEFISEKDVTFYMKQVLQGLQHIHEREVLHLDLKVNCFAIIFLIINTIFNPLSANPTKWSNALKQFVVG